MARSRLHKTFADYLAIAVSPLLIMLLVGSLVFFLLEVGYEGSYPSRARWILFWFVMAIVLVARIGIEQGPAYASGYGLALAAATSLVVFQQISSPVTVLVLLGVVWWSANKLTWDCTLIDDSVDASGQGLLQVAGLSDEAVGSAGDETQTTEHHESSSAPAANAPETDASSANQQQKRSGRSGLFSKSRHGDPLRRHAPGLWVVYFSLAALPVFGLGQTLLRDADSAARNDAFRLLVVYVTAGMGLLLTTSFLGLRRYLRQRRLKMPAAMAGAWFTTGGLLLLLVIALATLLPRPQAAWSATALLDRLASKPQEASDWSPLDDDAAEGEGQGGDAPDAEGQARARDDQGQGRGRDGRQPGRGQNGDQTAGQGRQQDAEPSAQDPQGQQGQQGQQGGTDRQTSQRDSDESTERGTDGRDGNRNRQRQSGNQNNRPDDEPNNEQQAGQQQQGREPGQSGETDAASETSESSSNSSTEMLSQGASWLARLLQWIIYAAIALAVLFVLIRHWATIQSTLNLFLAQLQNWLAGLLGRKSIRSHDTAGEGGEAASPPRRIPFSQFRDPFATGRDESMSETELLRYTFAALQAWGDGHGWPRSNDQTIQEYAERLRLESVDLDRAVSDFARVYTRISYGGSRLTGPGRKAMSSLWSQMTARAPFGSAGSPHGS